MTRIFELRMAVWFNLNKKLYLLKTQRQVENLI